MSDFDKEAERERLREKYEQDKQKREATEQMSELLLQGATMTNAHCSTCGDPVFRYDGQEFCPTCEKAVDREASADGQNGIEVTETSETPVAFGGAEEAGDGDREPQQSRETTETERELRRDEQAGQPEPRDSRDGGIPAARDALVESLVRFSDQAAGTDDPRQAQDSLAAAREAAEALSALDR